MEESASVENLSITTQTIPSQSQSTNDLSLNSPSHQQSHTRLLETLQKLKSENNLNSLSDSSPLTGSLNNEEPTGGNNNNNSNTPLNEKVAHLASSIYTELEKIVKLHGRDTVKDLMSIVVNILEGLDTAYQDKEELTVENELLKDDYEKLLSQYEREKQARKDTEIKLFQSEDSFAEQKKECEEKVKSLESIVRMIDLKSKNTSDHVVRLEEKEIEFKKEYTKLHERYTELFKNHCDYMERTKILFGSDSRLGGGGDSASHAKKSSSENQAKRLDNSKQILDILKPQQASINRSDLINALKSSTRQEINIALSTLLSQSDLNLNESGGGSTINASSTSSLSSLSAAVGQQQKPSLNTQQSNTQSDDGANNFDDGAATNNDLKTSSNLALDSNQETPVNIQMSNQEGKMNFQSSENFDEHLTEFDDTASIQSNSNNSNRKNNKTENNADSETDYEGEEETFAKNDQSLFNELSRENYDITELDDGADLRGMTREVANLIRENSELLETKHALNVLKDDLIVRLDQFTSEMVMLREEIESLQTMKVCLQLRITELEEEAKRAREELIQKGSKRSDEEDESIPISQRKRFTRAEMARVLMERNQYKEKLMDLQEAVRWTEMIRANSKVNSSQNSLSQLESEMIDPSGSNLNYESNEPAQEQKKKTTLWKFFSDLFGSTPNSQNSHTLSHSQTSHQISYIKGGSASSTSSSSSQPSQVSSSKAGNITNQNVEQVVPHSMIQNDAACAVAVNEKVSKAYEFLKEDKISKSSSSTSSSKLKANDLQLFNREEGRVQAYGWSLPASSSSSSSNKQISTQQKATSKFQVSVPVPVYCRPLFEEANSLKLSCSSTIDFSFNSNLLPDGEKLIESSIFSFFRSPDTTTVNPDTCSIKTSCIWNCNLNMNDTHVSIMDANKPGNIVYQFTLKNIKVHTIQTVSGVKKQIEAATTTRSNATCSDNNLNVKEYSLNQLNGNFEDINFIEIENESEGNDSTLNNEKTEKSVEATLPSSYPTMWMGSQEGFLLIHSSISNVGASIERIKLKDAVLCIIQNCERVIVGLADGSAAIFKRSSATNNWDLKTFQLINFDKPHHSIRCLANVYENVWCGCRNKIFVLNPIELKVLSVIEVHPRKENQVRHIVSVKDGVWISIRLDSTLRLYHAQSYQPLQYLDIEPFITRMLGTSNLGLSLIRISSLITGSRRLWIGTGNGVVLSIPFSEKTPKNILVNEATNKSIGPGGSAMRVVAEKENLNIPYCDINDTQFSFHGHRDSIKFFLNVPSEIIQKAQQKQDEVASTPTPQSYEKIETNLILSGGHGYIDFRIGDLEANNTQSKMIADPSAELSKNDRSHLIVWQINNY